jgi:hypothetical protein
MKEFNVSYCLRTQPGKNLNFSDANHHFIA